METVLRCRSALCAPRCGQGWSVARGLWLLALLWLLPLAGWAQGAPSLPAPLREAGWQAHGAGEMRFFGFSLYEAALWGPGAGHRDEQPFALVIRYRRDFAGERLVATSEDELRRLGLADEARLVRWRSHMQAAFPDVKAGQSITGHYLPGGGVRFYHGDALTAAVDDPEFARAFFAIWLDPRTRAPELRSRLLGEARDG